VRVAAARGGEEKSPENHRRGARGLAREAMGVQTEKRRPREPRTAKRRRDCLLLGRHGFY